MPSASAGTTRPRVQSAAGHQRARTPIDPLRHATFTRWIWGAVLVSVSGGALVFVFLSFAAPILLSPAATDRLLWRGGTALAVFAVVVVPVLIRVRRTRYAMSTVWLRQHRKPTDKERRMALGAPGEAVRVSALTWGSGAVFFGMLGATESVSAAAYIFSAVILGGITTTAVWYLIAERIMRPVSARALDGDPVMQRFGPSIQIRLAMAWTLATGVPLLGVATLAVGYLVDVGFEPHRTLAVILGLLVVALVVGFFTLVVAARSVAERVGDLRHALARVRAGDFTARVVVDDASEIGRLQVGFNAMAAGLAERERIREAFGTYVDRDVAEHILQGAAVQADEVEVTLMFVDVRSFTAFAERVRPIEVVATLNRLFERIVPLVHAHGGHVDKYAGDGLFAVFGAPKRHDDHADRALRAALEISEAVRDEFGTALTGLTASTALSVGIGLNSGPVVAGNIGGAGRFEFSVIGDAVNVAARVESATRQTGDVVLLTGETLALLHGEHGDFVARPGLVLKGKTAPVQIYAPAGTVDA
ncbi:adenylate/guanylate cyclase domain-containing protein [Mycolicibacterium moriokaense]|nr:adenylate/guanylate cyclase domain-containing protein [Mycolicibacterium moriokaense]